MTSRGCNIMAWLWVAFAFAAVYQNLGMEAVVTTSGVAILLHAAASILKALGK